MADITVSVRQRCCHKTRTGQDNNWVAREVGRTADILICINISFIINQPSADQLGLSNSSAMLVGKLKQNKCCQTQQTSPGTYCRCCYLANSTARFQIHWRLFWNVLNDRSDRFPCWQTRSQTNSATKLGLQAQVQTCNKSSKAKSKSKSSVFKSKSSIKEEVQVRVGRALT